MKCLVILLYLYGITIIGNNVFYGLEKLKKITLPNSVTEIGTEAFDTCTSLVEIEIPNSVTKIGKRAFRKCTSLVEVEIPNSVTEIGGGAFAYCQSLEKVKMNGVTKINSDTFYNCTSLVEIEIPNSVTEIGDYVFNCCYLLEKVNLSDNIQKIGDCAFFNCNSLKFLIIPKSILYIDDYAFSNVKGLNLNIETSLVHIGSRLIHNLLEDNISLLTIYNELIDFDKRLNKNNELNIDDIRKRELLDLIKNELNKNGIISKKNISYMEHKKIINEILQKLKSDESDMISYNYRKDLNPYLKDYIEKNKPKNAIVQISTYVNVFTNKTLDDVIEEVKKSEIEPLQNNSTYIDIFNYGKNMNEYPLYISSIFYNTVSRYSKSIKAKQIKQIFDQLTSLSKKQNILKKLFFKQSGNNEMVLNQELLQELNSSIDNEIIMVSNEMIILNKIKELIRNFIIKLQKYITYLNNYQINIDACLDSLVKSDELLKMSTRDARMQDFNNLIDSITEKYGQVNLVISSNLIYVSKLNNIKSNLLPTLLTKIMTNDVVSKDIQIIKETNDIAKILEEIILYQESINNNLDNSNLNLDESVKQLIKKENESRFI